MTAQIRRRTPRALLLTVLLMLALLLTAGHAKAVSGAVSERTALCLDTLIPSLYGCMLIGNLLQSSGCGAWLGERLPLLPRLLRLPRSAAGIFLISQLAGYPVGVMLLRRSAENGTLTRQQAAKLVPVCFGGGPAFLVGLTGARLFGSAAAGWVMLGSCVMSNLLLARCCAGGAAPAASAAPVRCALSAEMLTDAADAAVRALAQICGTVLLFGVLTALAEQTGLSSLPLFLLGRSGIPRQTARALLHTLTDVSLLPELFSCGLPFHILLPLTAGLLSFGGFCVHTQCMAAGGGLVSLHRLFGLRLCAALLTAAITAAAVPWIPLPDTAAVLSVQTAISATRSPIPALLIFFTGFPFLLKKD